MSSATGIPEENPATQGRGEDEPLLGRAGDASQQDGKGIQFNFVLGKPAVLSHTGHAKNADLDCSRHRHNRAGRHLDRTLTLTLHHDSTIH